MRESLRVTRKDGFMGKIISVILDDDCWEIDELIRRKIVSAVKYKDHVIVARHGVNKTTLRKMLK